MFKDIVHCYTFQASLPSGLSDEKSSLIADLLRTESHLRRCKESVQLRKANVAQHVREAQQAKQVRT